MKNGVQKATFKRRANRSKHMFLINTTAYIGLVSKWLHTLQSHCSSITGMTKGLRFMGIWTPFRASKPGGWYRSKGNKHKEDLSLLHHYTSEATGRIYAASVHESAARESRKL
jgi:hypothetical protein